MQIGGQTQFVVRPGKVQELLKDPRVSDMRLMAETFPWPTRIISWFVWSWPLKYLVRRRYRNPWAQVIVTMNAVNPEKAPVRAPGENRDLDEPETLRRSDA